jgi:hypothetical protein
MSDNRILRFSRGLRHNDPGPCALGRYRWLAVALRWVRLIGSLPARTLATAS